MKNNQFSLFYFQTQEIMENKKFKRLWNKYLKEDFNQEYQINYLDISLLNIIINI